MSSLIQSVGSPQTIANPEDGNRQSEHSRKASRGFSEAWDAARVGQEPGATTNSLGSSELEHLAKKLPNIWREAAKNFDKVSDDYDGLRRLTAALTGVETPSSEQLAITRKAVDEMATTRPVFRLAPEAKSNSSADLQNAADKAGTDVALPAGVLGATVSNNRSQKTILFNQSLEPAELDSVSQEEAGQIVAEIAENSGLDVAPGDVGFRMRQALQGRYYNPQNSPDAYAPSINDGGKALLDGRIVSARYRSLQRTPVPSGLYELENGTPQERKDYARRNFATALSEASRNENLLFRAPDDETTLTRLIAVQLAQTANLAVDLPTVIALNPQGNAVGQFENGMPNQGFLPIEVLNVFDAIEQLDRTEQRRINRSGYGYIQQSVEGRYILGNADFLRQDQARNFNPEQEFQRNGENYDLVAIVGARNVDGPGFLVAGIYRSPDGMPRTSAQVSRLIEEAEQRNDPITAAGFALPTGDQFPPGVAQEFLEDIIAEGDLSDYDESGPDEQDGGNSVELRDVVVENLRDDDDEFDYGLDLLFDEGAYELPTTVNGMTALAGRLTISGGSGA